MKSLILIACFIAVCVTSFGETDSDSTARTSSVSFLKTSLDFYSNNVYLGRKDADIQSIIMPSVGYFHKSGLYAVAAAGYIPQAGYQRFDMASAEAGYEYSGKNFYVSAAFAAYHFSDSSHAVNASVNSVLQFYGDYDFGFITAGTGVDFSFVNKTDFILNPVISHGFYFANDQISLTPTASLYAATENFYQSYLVNATQHGHSSSLHPNHGHGSNNSGSGGTTTSTTIEVQQTGKFKIMNYEMSIPFEYEKGKLIVRINPEYIIPVNPATIVEEGVTITETLKNSFVIVAGISYKFGHHS